uniref:Uncharacterized protein n=2 Tax=Chenopodium quinoa TaxID=63459 RepID=A0A803NDJ8_CHEQI
MAGIEPNVVNLQDPAAHYEKLVTELEVKGQAEANNAQLLAGDVELTSPTTNFTDSKLTKLDVHFWSGYTLTSFPDMNRFTTYYFREKGPLPQGVKWGYCYASGTDSTARKWVAAFDSAAGKAYCEAGPTGPVDWNVVEVKLNASGSSCEYVDPILGGRITAKITGLQAISTLY